MTAYQNGTTVIAVEDGGPRFKSDPSTGLMTFLDIVNTVTHLTLGAVSFVIVFVALNLSIVFPKLSQHMILCVLGYVILMAQSILVMSPNNGWSRTIGFQNKKLVHSVMHLTGAVLALTGGIIIMIEKNNRHFDSVHGCLGLVALILTFLSLIGGVIRSISSPPFPASPVFFTRF